METIDPTKSQLKYSNAYAKDLATLKQSFLVLNDCKTLTQDFGLPFLVIRNSKKIMAFASLISIDNKRIDFRIFYINRVSEEEKTEIAQQVNLYFSNGRSNNFKDIAQLQHSIDQLIFWLNS